MSSKKKAKKEQKKKEAATITKVKNRLTKFLGPEAMNGTEITLKITFKDGTEKSWNVNPT